MGENQKQQLLRDIRENDIDVKKWSNAEIKYAARVMLELPKNKEETETNNDSNDHQCPTCKKKYETRSKLNKHRANSETCKNDYNNRQKDKIELCGKCDNWIHGGDNWGKRKKYHCGDNNKDIKYHEIDDKGFCDRSKNE